MFDMIAGLCIAMLLVALYAVHRRARHARKRKLRSGARLQHGRTLSARTEMRAYGNPTTTPGLFEKRSGHPANGGWKRT